MIASDPKKVASDTQMIASDPKMVILDPKIQHHVPPAHPFYFPLSWQKVCFG